MAKCNQCTYLDVTDTNNSGNEYCLTTTICNILKMPDNNIYLESIKHFKNNVLKQDDKYQKIITDYESLETMISKELKNDILNERISIICFERYIGPIKNLIYIKDYESAIKKYKTMINTLKNIYKIDEKNKTNKPSVQNKYIQKKITLS